MLLNEPGLFCSVSDSSSDSTLDSEDWESEAERKLSWVQCAEIIWVWKRLQIAKFGIFGQAHSLSSPP
jgi:hypothetical protein